MTQNLTEDDMLDLAEACGKAFGAVLSLALVEPAPLDKSSLRMFAQRLSALHESDSFSGTVSIVVGGIVEGFDTALRGNLP